MTYNGKYKSRLAIIQLNSLVQKQMNLAKPIYDEISKYSQ